MAHVFLEGCKGGAPLPHALRRYTERLLGTELEDIRVLRSWSVETLGAAAVAVGERIVVCPSVFAGFNDEHTTHLLVHELTHVAQQRALRVPFRSGVVLDGALEAEAEFIADKAVRELAFSNPERHRSQFQVRPQPGWVSQIVLQPHPATPIIRKALAYIGKRSGKALSKHIAKHTRRNFEKAIHSVFRSIDKIRPLLRKTLEEGVQLSEHFAKNSGLEMVERNGVRLTRQTMQSPGKYRWLLQKEFDSAIGTKGEKVLRIVLDMSGRVVTAFPADKLLTTLGTIVAVDLFSEGVADAAENVEAEAERLAKFEEMQRSKIDLWDFVPGIGEIWGGNLNEFEDLELAHDRWLDKVVKDVVDQAEWRAQRSFGNRSEIEEIVRIGLGLPVLLEHGE
ncbi:eCIS core domain-containing protein [Vineibacter terrae]|uniref:eCIS core domain-containing protein n=1 Tax=Vineibacter terrae TaxID=2586908 RepID=UPI0015B50470|nr:DUF4157 domain-containing protein [Vineibacter terrae]